MDQKNLPLVAILGALVALVASLGAMAVAWREQPAVLGGLLAAECLLLLAIGIVLGLMRRRSRA